MKRGEEQVFTSSMYCEVTKKWNSLAKSPEELLLPKLPSEIYPMVKQQVVKIELPTLLFIECFGILKVIL